jgi:hypothetical protein
MSMLRAYHLEFHHHHETPRVVYKNYFAYWNSLSIFFPIIILSSSFSKDFWLYRDPHSRSLENCAGSKSSSHSNSYQIDTSALNPSTSNFSSKLSYMGRKKIMFCKEYVPNSHVTKKILHSSQTYNT